MHRQAISFALLTRYSDYAAAFYAVAAGSGARPVETRCVASSAPCIHLRQQVLRRLIEEHIVLLYAANHHVILTPQEKQHVKRRLLALQEPGSSTALLLEKGVVTTSFLRTVLTTQAIVRKVELTITGRAARIGNAYHLRVVSFFVPAGNTGVGAHLRAARVVASRTPISPAAATSTDWFASFRLARSMRAALDHAVAGQWTGPFRRAHAWVAVLLLGKAEHRLGRPARLLLQTHLFHAWLHDMMRRAPTACYAITGKEVRCPSAQS